jgi:hypothetical protein
VVRAAVLIGANRTGKLPVLNDAAEGARRMEEWCLSQGMARHRVQVFTDENGGTIDVRDIRLAVKKLVDSGSVEQLIVYFAGHGVNIRYGEYWLLTDAPEDASAAVNVEGSMVLARRCGIPHVVFISDACRTAAEGVQAQGITGTEIFPNDPVAGPESPVDIFFGTALGRPALEVKDPAVSSAVFKAVYTTALLDAISGKLPAVLESATLEGEQKHLVRPRPLKSLLLSELPRRVSALGLAAQVSQTPDARITSDDGAWLSSLSSLSSLSQVAATAAAPRGARPRARAPVPDMPDTPETRARRLLLSRLSAGPGAANAGEVPPTAAARAPMSRARARGANTAANANSAAPARRHVDTGCGFVVNGSAVAEALSAQAQVAVVSGATHQVRVDTPAPAANVLLRLQDGSGLLLPALSGFVTTVSIADEEVVDVAYEPSENSPGWTAFAPHEARLRDLRAVVSNAARDNAFRVDEHMAELLSLQMRYDGQMDPALALYAAYAFHELGMGERVQALAVALQAMVGMRFFDLELLSPRRDELTRGVDVARLPPVPMLARGWTFLSAYRMPLPEPLAGIERQLRPSLWTHFDRDGTDRLRDLILTRRLQ